MTTELDTSAMETYLRGLDYAEQSIHQTAQRARRLERIRTAGTQAQALPPHWRTHLLRIVVATEAEALPAELGEFAAGCALAIDKKRMAARPGLGLRGGRKPKGRVRSTRSVPDEAWEKLLGELARIRTDPADEGACAVLYVEATTGLRVGDILRIPVRTLVEGVPRGVLELEQKGGSTRTLYVKGAEDAWKRLAKLCAKAPSSTNVAGAIGTSEDVSSSGGTYSRCKRLLKRLQAELRIDRLHTHRLRRTVGVQTLRMTGDIVSVQQLLGQVPGSKATYDYLDEARPERSAELTQQIRERFGGKR